MDNIFDPDTNFGEVQEVPEVGDFGEVAETFDTYQTDSVADFAVDTANQVQEAVNAISQMDGIRPETWQTLEAGDRLGVLQGVENSMAEIQGRQPVEILPEELPENVFGGYDPVTQMININSSHLHSDMPVQEYVDTVVHEGRHAYQDFAVRNPQVVSDVAVVNAWVENMHDYHTAELYGQEEYTNQPVEADAWNYAGEIRHGIYGNE